MSVRAVGVRLWKHGRSLVQTICKREIHTNINISNKVNATIQQQQPLRNHRPALQLTPNHLTLRNVGVQLGLQARRILIDNVLNRVTNSLAADLRKRAARRILYGDSGPFFALVGISLASGTGILTKEEELEGVCYEIREAVSKINWNNYDAYDNYDDEFEKTSIKLNDLTLGKAIAKGANGIVYSTHLKEHKENHQIDEYPFALKMLFNYDIQSNSMAILKAMYRETIPARYYCNNYETEWEEELLNHGKILPPHPNIVKIYSIFTDYIEDFENSRELYPAALPKRLHPDGIGRNMSLFLLMKRYNINLDDYLKQTNPPLRTSILIFAQLLEAIVHLNRYGIAHRDIKSDNFLIDTNNDQNVPTVVLSDFGCCLADKNHGLQLPYTTDEIDKGGNHALMAPEIINKRPGLLSVLNYTKSDLWSVGTLAYEIFGCPNPFYFINNNNKKSLRNSSYKEDDLPQLPDNVPDILRLLVRNLLKRNPNQRLEPDVAANVVQLYLWAPGTWLKQHNSKLPSNAEILQWLLSLTTKILCEGGINNKSFGQFGNKQQQKGRRTFPEYLLISSFLCRVKLASIRSALSWIHDEID